MTGPWDHPAGGHDDPHDPHGLPGLPEEEPAAWSAPDEPWADDLPAPDPDHEPAALPVADAGHGDLPAELPAEWPHAAAYEPEPEHADWSSIVAAEGGDDPDPTDPTDPAGWGAPAEDPFPPALSLDVEPADGGPWADPDLLGSDVAEEPRTDPPLALLADLSAADGSDARDWGSVERSDDPAIRSLAAYWRAAV